MVTLVTVLYIDLLIFFFHSAIWASILLLIVSDKAYCCVPDWLWDVEDVVCRSQPGWGEPTLMNTSTEKEAEPRTLKISLTLLLENKSDPACKNRQFRDQRWPSG